MINPGVSKVLARVARNFRVESAEKVSPEELAAFLKRAYNDQFNSDYYQNKDDILKRWEWANLKNPNAQKSQFSAWICRNNADDSIVGHFALTPVILKCKKAYTYCVWGRNLIVLAEFRHLGIGPFLIEKVLQEASRDFSLFMIAGLNDQVYPIYRKFGFTDLGNIPLYIRINRLDCIIEKKIRNKPLARILGSCGNLALGSFYRHFTYLARLRHYEKDIKISLINGFNSSFDSLWQEVNNNFSIIVKRDSLSLNWRFFEQPFWNYHIFKAENIQEGGVKGYIALREGESKGFRVGVISDILTNPHDYPVTASLIGFAISFFEKRSDIDMIRCNITDNRLGLILKRFGFKKMRSNSRFMFFSLSRKIDVDYLFDNRNWFITYADSDLDLY